jgi:hypothetical protein
MYEEMLPFDLIQTGTPIHQGLNSYYIDIHKLIEHYQGELESGGLSFNSAKARGALFFDKDEMINGYFQENGDRKEGFEAIDLIVDLSKQHNFSIGIFKIEPELVYYFSNIHSTQIVYDNLSSEFTDLGGLVRKLSQEKFTGYICVRSASDDTQSAIFFLKGKIIAHCDSEKAAGSGFSQKGVKTLILKVTEQGGMFKVYQILTVKDKKSTGAAGIQSSDNKEDVNSIVEELLNEVSEFIDINHKKTKVNSSTLIKKKFIEKANRYPFLDPFAAEFDYTDKTVSVHSNIKRTELISGIIDSLKAVAEELNQQPKIEKIITLWSEKHATQIKISGSV